MSKIAALAFRICPVTGLKVDQNAEKLIKINAVFAVLSLLAGGIAALLVLFTRWPATHLLDATGYYRALTFHGINMLIFWIIFFEIAVLYFAGPVLLNSRLPAPRLGWLGFALMLAGSLAIDWQILAGKADVMMTSYAPLKATPIFYLGWILFAVGALLGVSLFFASLAVAKKEKTYQGSLPLVTFGAAAAAIIAVVTILHGAAIYIPTFLWSVGIIDNLDPAAYRIVWWGLGHPSQQINVAAMISIWYLIATLATGAMPISDKVCRGAFVLYILFINLASAHHLLVDPGVSSTWKVWNTSYAMYLAVFASMIHGLTVPGSMEAALRRQGFTKGLFEWLRRAPWGNPGFVNIIFSIIVFGFIGGITGVTFGTEQINIIAHNTLRIPGHFHATVAGGTTLAFMGVTYYVVPLIFRRQIISKGWSLVQAYTFGPGIAIFAIGMMMSGTLGVGRRTWDFSASGSNFPLPFGADVNVLLTVMAIGGMLALTGGILYVLITVGSVFFGKPMPTTQEGAAKIIKLPPIAVAERPSIKGSITLAIIFLIAFVVFYFLNWQGLGAVWPVK